MSFFVYLALGIKSLLIKNLFKNTSLRIEYLPTNCQLIQAKEEKSVIGVAPASINLFGPAESWLLIGPGTA